MDAFGPTLDYFCERQGIKLYELATLMEVHRNTIDNWKARGRPPNQEVTVKLAKKLNLGEEETNTLLLSAGYAPKYSTQGINLPSPIKKIQEAASSDKPQIDLAVAETAYCQQVIRAYNRLSFSGFERGDLFLDEVPLENIFVRLTLTVEKVIREPEMDLSRTKQHVRGQQEQVHIIKVQEPVELSQIMNNHLLIVGEPGAGKSTLLQWLAVTFAQKRQREPDRLGVSTDEDRLPILIDLGQLPNTLEQFNWLEFLPRYIATKAAFWNTPPLLLERALANGRCLLLFDGLDEIADRQARFQLVHSLTELARLSPGNRVIIGSRPSGVSENEGMFHSFRRCQIQRFTAADIRRFFHFWFALDGTLTSEQQHDEAERLYSVVQATPKTLDLATTPLLSTILILLWRNEGSLPTHRAELYEHCCRILIEHWENSHAVQTALSNLTWQEHLHLLSSIAYHIHSKDQRTNIARDELIQLLADALQSSGYYNEQTTSIRAANQLLNALGLRSGLLQYIGDDKYAFLHLIFQEYLAALYIAEQDDCVDLVMKHIHESWWEEVYLLTISHLTIEQKGILPATNMLLTILHQEKPPLWFLRPTPSLLTLGKRFPQVQLRRRLNWILARSIELAAKGYAECPSARDGPIARVGALLSEHAVTLTKQILSDRARCLEQARVLKTVYLCLQHHGNEEVMARLLVKAWLSEDYWNREGNPSHNPWIEPNHYVKYVLIQMGAECEKIVEGFIDALHRKYEEGGLRVLGILEEIGVGNEKVIGTLLEYYQKTSKGLGVLEKVGGSNEKVIQVFLEQLQLRLDAGTYKHDRFDESNTLFLVGALGRIGTGNKKVIELLLKAADSISDGGLYKIAESLGQVGRGDQRVIEALVKILRDHDDISIFEAATVSLGQVSSGNEMVIETLLQLIDRVSGVRLQTVIQTLGHVGREDERVVSTLLTILQHRIDDRRAILGAVVTLGRIGNAREEVKEALLTVLQCYDVPRIIIAAINALVRLGVSNEKFIEILLALLRPDNDTDIIEAAAKALVKLGVSNEKFIEALLAIMEQHVYVQSRCYNGITAATDVLGQIGVGNEKVIEALLDILREHHNWLVIQKTGEALGHVGVGNDKVIEELLQLMKRLLKSEKSLEISVRQTVIKALGHIGGADKRVIEVLLDTFWYRLDEYTQSTASEVLEQIGINDRSVIEKLLTILRRRYSPFTPNLAIRLLGNAEIKDQRQLRQVITNLNRYLHTWNSKNRRTALASISHLLDGQSLPGYRWVSFRKRRAQRLRLKRIAFWLGMSAIIVMIGLAVTWLLDVLNPSGFPMRLLAVLASIIAFAAAIVQILGRTLRDPWEHS